MTKENLNYQIEKENGRKGYKQYSIFKDLLPELKKLISEHDCVLGCVYSATHFGILSEMTKMHGASLILNESNLRDVKPQSKDNGYIQQYKESLRGYYQNLPVFGNNCYIWVDRENEQYTRATPDRSLYSVGASHQASAKDQPLMHNKFLIFYKGTGDTWPSCVWTGSFNISDCSGNSLENALVTYDPEIVLSYQDQFFDILKIAKPINP